MDSKQLGEQGEYFEIESKEHLQYVQGYTRILAEEYARLYPNEQLTEEKIEKIVKASNLHDIGKVTIPEMLCQKVGRLSEYEMDIMKLHTIKGSQLIDTIQETEDYEYNEICRNICMYHHEKYDGTGYPYGLEGSAIPIEAQLVGLADMYDILIHCSVNKEVFSNERAVYMLMSGECGGISDQMKKCLDNVKGDMAELVLES